MSELDTLFNLDSSLDTLDKTVHDKLVIDLQVKCLQLTAYQKAGRQHTSTGARGSAEAATRGRGTSEPGNWQLVPKAQGQPAPKPHVRPLPRQGHSSCQQPAGSQTPTDNGHPRYAARSTQEE